MRVGGGSVIQVAGALNLDNATGAIDEILSGLGRARMFAATIIGSSGAGNLAVAEVRNPAASGKTLYFLLGDFWVAIGMQVSLVFNGTTLAPAGVPSPMLAGGAASVAVVGGSNVAAPTGTKWHTTGIIAANTPYILPAWFWGALPPGNNLQLQGQTATTAFQANLRWIELSA